MAKKPKDDAADPAGTTTPVDQATAVAGDPAVANAQSPPPAVVEPPPAPSVDPPATKPPDTPPPGPIAEPELPEWECKLSNHSPASIRIRAATEADAQAAYLKAIGAIRTEWYVIAVPVTEDVAGDAAKSAEG